MFRQVGAMETVSPGWSTPLPGAASTTSASGAVARSWSMSVKELFTGSESFQPGGTVMVAVLESGPVAPGATVTVAMKAADPLKPRSMVVLMSPLPLGAPQVAPAPAWQVQVALISSGGKVSTTAAPMTGCGPRLLTTMV